MTTLSLNVSGQGGSGRRWLKKWLRVPVRQTEAYLRSFKDGTFRDSRRATPTGSKSASRGSGKAILLLDYALPTPDRDAGSRTVFEHIVSLTELGYDVAFWPSDGLDVPRYAHPLRRLGVQVVAGYFRPSLKSWLAARQTPISHVLLNRPEVAAVHLETLRAARLPILYYGHDLHFARLGMEAEKSGDAVAKQRSQEMKRLEHAIWRRANVSTYPSDDEARHVAALEPKAAARPLLAFCFDDFPERDAAPAGAEIMFVGSFRHSPNVAAAELLAREIFPRVRRQIPEARLVIAGAYATEGVKALAGDGVEVAGWLSDEALAALYARSRLAVVPLEVGAGIKLKVVEALSKGIPLVTTPVGAQGMPGLEQLFPVCAGAEAMAEAVVRMLQLDDQTWLRKSWEAVQYARDHFSRQAMKRSLDDALKLAAATKPVE